MRPSTLLCISLLVLASNLVQVLSTDNTIDEAEEILESYKALVVNGRREGKDCKTDDPVERDIVYTYIEQVAGKSADEIVKMPLLETAVVRRALGEHKAKLDLCAVSRDLYCSSNSAEGTETCKKCGGTCYDAAPYVKAVMEAKDWQKSGDGNPTGGGGTSTGGEGGKSTGGGGGTSSAGGSPSSKGSKNTEAVQNGIPPTASRPCIFLLLTTATYSIISV